MNFKSLLLWAYLALPLVVFILRLKYPRNMIVRCFVPRHLTGRRFFKFQYREAGTGCLLFAVWLVGIPFVMVLTFGEQFMDDNAAFIGVLMFASVIVAGMSLFIAVYYLWTGFFGSRARVAPEIGAELPVYVDEIDTYIRKLRFYLIFNTVVVAVFAGVLIMVDDIANMSGYHILFLTVLIIAFLMTLSRLNTYIDRAAVVMNHSTWQRLLFTFVSPLSLFLAHVQAVFLLIAYAKRKRREDEEIRFGDKESGDRFEN
jgi:hypothetical protein